MLDTNWFSLPKSASPARLHLFCLPFAGGGSSIYNRFPNGLADGVQLCAVRLPGRETRFREPAWDNLESALNGLQPILEAGFDKPFAFFGHSMGALMAFEMTRRLQARSGPVPMHLFVSGFRAPHRMRGEPPISHLPASEFFAELERRYGTTGGEGMNRELLELMLPTLRADCGLCEKYSYSAGPPLTCDLTAFGGHNDNMVSAEDIAEWDQHTTGAFEFHMLDGDHFFLNNKMNSILSVINRALAPTVGLDRRSTC